MSAPAIPQLDLEQYCNGAETIAEIAETPCNRAVFQPVVEAYRELFHSGVASYRTTTKPVGKRELDVRYVNVAQPHDPYQMALDHGFYTETGHPAESLMREIHAHSPIVGYGVDTSVNRGFTKIWSLFTEGFPVTEMLALPSVPPAAHDYVDFFAQNGLHKLGLVAIDFVSKVFNLYFMFRTPEKNPPDLATNLISGLDFNLPSAEEQSLFSHCGDAHFTFTWDSSVCERLSFVVWHAPVDYFPTHLHPMFPSLVEAFPTVRDQRYASVQSSYSKEHGDYLKIEMDYSGMGLAMRAAMDAAGRTY